MASISKPVAGRSRKLRKQKNGILRVTQKFHRIERYNYLPSRPVIATKVLDGAPLTFCEFLFDRNCRRFLTLLLNENCTAGATMVRDFRLATRGLYFGHRRATPDCPRPENPEVLDAKNSVNKKALREFARRAYRGDPEQRDQIFWKQMAELLWNIYGGLMALRAKSARIKRREIERIAKLPAKRAKAAARVRKCRANKASR